MTFEEKLKALPPDIIWTLFREKMRAQGRYDAFILVQECKGDIKVIQEKLAEYEELIANPTGVWVQALTPNTSVRLHKDGLMEGLRDALKILTQAERASQPAPQPEASPTRMEGT